MPKITQYPAKTVPSNNDEFVFHEPASGSTKKMTRGDLIGGAPLPANSVNQIVNQALQSVYPVGSLYYNATNSANPASLFGFGTWVAFGAGRVPVGFNSSDSDFNSAQKTGGAKTVTLTTSQIPAHRHRMRRVASEASGWGLTGTESFSGRPIISSTNSQVDTGDTNTGQTGGGGSHNNLQPYITVYMWKRTA